MWNSDLFVAVKVDYLKTFEKKKVIEKPVESDSASSKIINNHTSDQQPQEEISDANGDNKKRKADDNTSEQQSPPQQQQQQQQQGKLTLKKRHQQTHPDKSKRMCSFVLRNAHCPYEKCQYSHDLQEYIANKEPDIALLCPVFERYGYCPSGISCRFGDSHIDRQKGLNLRRSEEQGGSKDYQEINYLSKSLQIALRKKKYPKHGKLNTNDQRDNSRTADRVVQPAANNSESSTVKVIAEEEIVAEEGTEGVLANHSEEVVAEVKEFIKEASPLKPEGYSLDAYPSKEKVKLVDFSNKVYVAPLTTVGNLPFRRILKEYGADITCGEMAMTNNLLSGQTSEWALLRRHPSEDIFGIQIAGNHPDNVGKLCNVLEHETETDFVDLNCGCPIDLVCNAGAGSGLLNRHRRLCDIFKVMAKNLPTRSVTVKVRIGWDEKVPTTHKLIPELQSVANGRLAAIMIHGRSRLQRYHKLANWDYILQCARSQDPTKPLIPIIGNGDILSWTDWQEHQLLLQNQFQSTDNNESSLIGLCSCAMIARGALIKPWLPQEIKEQRNIDISAKERLEIIEKFCYYGLEHWGSDGQGIETTRRFLLEWLSFLHRYVPLGIIEKIQRMNQRPPAYYGRDDLETLLSSTYCEDWIKLSEMFLGKVKEDYHFIPKHKSNSYAPEAESLMRQYERGIMDGKITANSAVEESALSLAEELENDMVEG